MTDNTYMEIKVKPNQPKFKIIHATNPLTVGLKSKPDKNQANIELMKMFTKILKTPVTIVSGEKSKNKTIKIESMTEIQVLEVLKGNKENS
ncbi:MAG: DUF167 domain-containing protein [Candidatus Aenigmarchaeota archaeon]|nr:DUF167 domain-containing protein [Candidatus Aenigmarchaeota archaeon]